MKKFFQKIQEYGEMATGVIGFVNALTDAVAAFNATMSKYYKTTKQLENDTQN